MPCPTRFLRTLLLIAPLGLLGPAGSKTIAAEPERNSSPNISASQREFFEKRIRPILVAHCYECHNSKHADGELALDHRERLLAGGSGGPIVVPGKAGESRLLAILRHEVEGLEMPQDGAKLTPQVIADFETWIDSGAFDPRDEPPTAAELAQVVSGAAAMQLRRQWWSLQPVVNPPLPAVKDESWSAHPIDRFILAKLEQQSLSPAPEAARQVLLRRLTFALTGLPPTRKEVEDFLEDSSADAYERMVDRLLASPHFGQRWARHWMDVVHYSDTHGYEWDTPAKNAWMYRDYLVRAFNADLPFNRLVREQIAGDLLSPRIDPVTGLNEAMLGPMAMRLGERRHGDNAAADGVTQEAMANIIDTVSKGFLGTTIACSQCHDHKFDAVPQSDFYALSGVFMNTRWGVRCADAIDPNIATLEELKQIKQAVRKELAARWLNSREAITARLLAMEPPAGLAGSSPAPIPASFTELWHRQTTAPLSQAEFQAEHQRRVAANRANLKLWADFTPATEDTVEVKDRAAGWRWEGFGMRHGLVPDGAIVISTEGNHVVEQFLPAGRWSHVWSQRLAGALRSPLIDTSSPLTFSIGYAGGKYAAHSFIVDHAFHSERMAFINQSTPAWLNLTAGKFDRLAGGVDTTQRRVYFELATKALNNYFPPRTGYGGVSEAEAADPKSWFGVTRIYQHAPGQGPLDELTRFKPVFAAAEQPQSKEAWASCFADTLLAAIARWSKSQSSSEDVVLLSEALSAKWLDNEAETDSALANLLASYRATEARLQPDRTIGSAAEWSEAFDERISVRGSYVDFGKEVPRGQVALLAGIETKSLDTTSGASSTPASGRLELAELIASEKNPLTARVFVNRVWLQLFGEGLVRTPDDFGHLGELPTHPELLDWLAHRFVEDNWSLKKQIKRMVMSRAWRQSGQTSPEALKMDPENRLWHHRPLRRLEAEAIRDALLAVSGRMNPEFGGPPIDPYRAAEDAAKRLFSGPLDGNGRRSIYLKMTLMEPPKFLAIFNQPIPKLTVGQRDTTNVPDQALAMLNDPFVVAMANHWSMRLLQDGSLSCPERAERMLFAAFARPPQAEETERLVELVRNCVKLRGGDPAQALQFQPVWQDAAHALFNAKEFIYVD